MADIFISYRAVRRPAATYLANVLENYGYTVWYDYALLTGAAFAQQIERELRDAGVVLVMWCDLAVGSRWVLEEADLARELGTLLPTRIDNVSLPMGFRTLDTIDLHNWDGNPRGGANLNRLLDQIALKLRREPVSNFRALSQQEENWRVHSFRLSEFPLQLSGREIDRARELENLETTQSTNQPKQRSPTRHGPPISLQRKADSTENAIAPKAVRRLQNTSPRIKVIGIGNAGANSIENLIGSRIPGVEFAVANSDNSALVASSAEHRIQLGPQLTQGLGCGARPEIGRAAAEESLSLIRQELDGLDLCFLIAGMGGGTGSGAAPVFGREARALGIPTIAVVSTPFAFEGDRRKRAAAAAIDELLPNVDSLIVIPNQNLFLVAKPETTFKEAFAIADDMLVEGIRCITDLLATPGLIAVRFDDLKSLLSLGGRAMMGSGEADTEDRAIAASKRALANPLLDDLSIQGAKGIMISIVGGVDLRLEEVEQVVSHIRESIGVDAKVFFGTGLDTNLKGKIRVAILATGLNDF